MPRKYLLLLAAAMLCAAAAAGWARTTRHVPVLERLERARPERTFSPRLSIDTEYRPCTTQHRPVHPDSTVPREQCGRGAEPRADPHAFALAGESSAPDSLQAAALGAVIWWDETDRSMHEAVTGLKKALRLSREPVPLLVDLSATYLVRAQRTQSPQDLIAGLDAAKEALSHEPRNAAALFNAALAMDAVGLLEQAALGWDAYLAVDTASASAWAAEALARKRALTPEPMAPAPRPGASAAEVDSFAARHPQEARLLGWNGVLGDWGRAVVKGDADGAAAFLELAERLGAAVEKHNGDLSLTDAVRAIRAAAGNRLSTMVLARAHRDYADAQSNQDAARHAAAVALLDRVVSAEPPSPVLLHYAEALRAPAMAYGGQPARADATLKALLLRIDTARHAALEARIRWIMGTRLLRTERYPQAREQYGAALAIYRRLGETEHAGSMLSYDSETAYLQGDTASAYRSMHQALHLLRPYRSSVFLHNQLMVAANWATEGMRWAAPPIQDEGVSVALRLGRPWISMESLMARANVKAITGDTSGARQDLDTAAPLVTRVPADARDRMEATLRFSRVAVEPLSAAPRSAAALDSAIGYFGDEGDAWWLLRALIRRAEVRSAAGDLTGATRDLDTVTARIRRLSRREQNPLQRGAVIEQARDRFDQLVMLYVHAGRADEALRALERGRVSFGPAWESGRPGRRRIQAPRGQVAVEYALIGDTLITWTVQDTSVELVHAIVKRREFLLVAEQVGASLEAGGEDAAGLARLYDWLIRPVRHRLGDTGTTLVVLADGEVAGVPFAALRDTASGRYLVHDHAVRYAATLADAALPRPPRSSTPPRALLVADPAFDRGAHPTLDPLPGARGEARALGELYPNHQLLDSVRATRAALIAGARSAGVIHYAGHAIFDDARPERSFLVLADTGEDGHLTADSVSAMRLAGVRLVVLSACRTLRSREGRSGGFAGLSGALLTAGAGGVVGSLWEVDDRRTQPLMKAFHREYLRSGDPAAALRNAQLLMLASRHLDQRSPTTWAGFRYAGR
jgi:CHAT domain-containing protein